jgi:altronate dehydratase large subunit
MFTCTTSGATGRERVVRDAMSVEAPGRRRPGGAVGVRHHFLVIPSVLCAAQAAHMMAEGIPGGVAIEHQHGCSQLGGDARLTERILTGLGTHPNVAGTLVVSLGCETVQGILLHRAIQHRGQRAEFVGIQQSGGTLAATEAGREALVRLREAALADPVVPISWRDLRVGIEATWLSIRPAQTAVFARVIDDLLSRGATVIQAVPAAEGDGRDGVDTPRVSSLPGLGGRRAETISYATPTTAPELVLMPAPETRIAQKTGLAAAGAHVILSPLVDGLPAGCPVAPVVHVGIAPYARAFAGDVEAMLDEEPGSGAAQRVLEALATACRDETATELLGSFEMAIHRIAPTM